MLTVIVSCISIQTFWRIYFQSIINHLEIEACSNHFQLWMTVDVALSFKKMIQQIISFSNFSFFLIMKEFVCSYFRTWTVCSHYCFHCCPTHVMMCCCWICSYFLTYVKAKTLVVLSYRSLILVKILWSRSFTFCFGGLGGLVFVFTNKTRSNSKGT